MLKTTEQEQIWAREFTARYRKAMAKGLRVNSWEEALQYLRSIGVDVSDPALRRL